MFYELTLTLRPRMYKESSRGQFELTAHLVRSTLYAVCNSKATIIAELTGENNIHYHCLIELKDLNQRAVLLNKFRSHDHIFGKKTCTPVQYYDSYIQYLVKDHKITREVLGICPIVTDDYEIYHKGIECYANQIMGPTGPVKE